MEVNPCGRIAGLAEPFRARSPEDREAYLASFIAKSPSLANHAPAEAGCGALSQWMGNRTGRRRKDGATEILLQPISDIIPQLHHFFCGLAVGVDFHDRSAIDHRGSEIRPMMKGDRGAFGVDPVGRFP